MVKLLKDACHAIKVRFQILFYNFSDNVRQKIKIQKTKWASWKSKKKGKFEWKYLEENNN